MIDNLTADTTLVELADGVVIDVTFNPAGQNGWLKDVFVSWIDHDEQLVWQADGTSLDAETPDIQIVIN